MEKTKQHDDPAASNRASHSHAPSSAARIDQMTALLVYAPGEVKEAPAD